jgi:hypothetical protein
VTSALLFPPGSMICSLLIAESKCLPQHIPFQHHTREKRKKKKRSRLDVDHGSSRLFTTIITTHIYCSSNKHLGQSIPCHIRATSLRHLQKPKIPPWIRISTAHSRIRPISVAGGSLRILQSRPSRLAAGIRCYLHNVNGS